MKKLYECAQLIRSKNAGPFMLTIDIIFPDEETYEKIAGLSIMETSNIAEKIHVDSKILKRYDLPLARAIKYSFPRQVPCGDFLDEDLYGCQYHGSLVKLEVPI